MLSKQASRKKGIGASTNGKFLGDLESMSSAFYSDKPLSRLASSTASSRSKSVGKLPLPPPEPKRKPEDAAPKSHTKPSSDKDKKSSIWSWKGLKALTNTRNHMFNCRFSLSVHSIDGLPGFLNDACLVVHWKRRDIEQTTRPVRVSRGVARFEEELTHSCSVYGSRSGPHHSAKYEAKHFLLYVSVYSAPDLDLGKHRIDLTRLLPLKLEGLEKGSGKWTTSFRLSGRARGAVINVSFGYDVIESNDSDVMSLQQSSERTIEMNNVPSLPLEEAKDLHEFLPLPKSELCDSVSILYQKLDDKMCCTQSDNEVQTDSSLPPIVDSHIVKSEHNCESEYEMTEFSIVDKGTAELDKEDLKPKDESLEVDEPISHALDASKNDEQSKSTCQNYEGREDEMYSKESLMKELEAALSCTSELVNELDFQDDEADAINIERYLEGFESDYRDPRKGKSLSLDDVTESVAQDFLDMLGMEGHNSPIINISTGSESEPESPRERLLREFEKEALANGGLLGFDINYDPAEFGFDFREISKTETYDDGFVTDNNNQTKASRMEDLETEALMREWGFNEKAFQHSPSSSEGFGSPINANPEDYPQQLPPLAEGFGPFVNTKNGGFMRSMNSALFRNSKSGGSLIMQVSNPVVVPAEMGEGVMGILQGLASVGIEKLSLQANKLMPLEDVTGKTIEQIAWEGGADNLQGLNRQDVLPSEHMFETGKSHVPIHSRKSGSSLLKSDPEYVSLEDLAPLAMDKIEALSIEGLRIHSGMSDEKDAPSNISTQSIGDFSALKGKTADVGEGESIGLDGTCGLQLIDIKDNGGEEEVDDGLGLGLGLGLSLTLDEWMKLDSGEIDEEELVSERTSKILAAHHATSLDVFRGRSKRKGKSKKYGLLGNNFTVALMVQLRDPLRDYEAVGAPMLALVQVERVFVPPKARIYGTVSMVRDFCKEDENVVEESKDEVVVNEEEEVNAIPQYKITEVRVAGLKTEDGKKKLWGSTNHQQQSGSRWLLANGMGKKKNDVCSKNSLVKSKAAGKSSLWSIVGKKR